MHPVGDSSAERLGEILRQLIREGFPVSIEGLGLFFSGRGGLVEFVPNNRPRVFLAYVDEDYHHVARIYDALLAAGFDPWLDKRKLLPGQDWPACIERAIGITDFFVPCFSERALRKRGQFQRELRHALECAAQMPLDDVFFVPLRLEACDVPRRIRSHYQYVDLFPDWAEGIGRLIGALRNEVAERPRRR